MSMFYELMMRKKEQIMYATIKGSLTENDGVFSGFSASNYLALQQNFAPTGSWEVCVKIKTGTTTVSPVRYFFGCWGTGNIVVGTTTGTYFKAFISTNNGSSYNVTLTTSSVVSTETVYYVKLGFTGTKYYLEQSTDGVNFVGRVEYSSTAKISSFPVNFGKVYANENIWNGDIDLSNSYIKLGSTKYNLQAVVGYTVVGSPTITDGVVSGFSGSDYLATGKYLSADKIEISIPFSFDPLNWNDIFWGRGNQQLNQLYEVTSGSLMRLYFQQGFAGYIDVARVYINTNYRIIITLTYDDFAYKIINEDTNTIVVEGVKERTTKAKPYLDNSYFGRSAPNSKIVIKDTTIKADGKLWFNGQPS